MLTVGVDVDDVCVQLRRAWLEQYNRDYGDDVALEQVTSWDLRRFIRCGDEIAHYLLGDIYASALPVVGAREGVAKLRELGHRVVFVTSVLRNFPASYKIRWLEREGFLTPCGGDLCMEHEEVVVLSDKSLIRADVLIDDNWDNVRTFPGLGIVFTQPWNAAISSPHRADTWDQVVEWVQAYHEFTGNGMVKVRLLRDDVIRAHQELCRLSGERLRSRQDAPSEWQAWHELYRLSKVGCMTDDAFLVGDIPIRRDLWAAASDLIHYVTRVQGADHDVLCNQALSLLRLKNHDYARADDPFVNFRRSGLVGIVARLADKLQRLDNFRATRRLAIVSESVTDTCLDVINYAIILVLYDADMRLQWEAVRERLMNKKK